MNRTSQYYSEDISQTALALLALVAAGKTLDPATVQAMQFLLNLDNDSRENRVHLTVFSGHEDEDGDTELPVIIPFVRPRNNESRLNNGYGTLSFENRATAQNDNSHFRLRIFSPDTAAYQDEEDSPYPVASTPALKVYAE